MIVEISEISKNSALQLPDTTAGGAPAGAPPAAPTADVDAGGTPAGAPRDLRLLVNFRTAYASIVGQRDKW